jgi:hypothetical protein
MTRSTKDEAQARRDLVHATSLVEDAYSALLKAITAVQKINEPDLYSKLVVAKTAIWFVGTRLGDSITHSGARSAPRKRAGMKGWAATGHSHWGLKEYTQASIRKSGDKWVITVLEKNEGAFGNAVEAWQAANSMITWSNMLSRLPQYRQLQQAAQAEFDAKNPSQRDYD